MKHSLALSLALALLHTTAGCKRKPSSNPEVAAPIEAAAAVANPNLPPTTAASSPAPVAASTIVQSKPGASESNPLNAELTDAVARFRDKHRRLPANWQELVQAGFLKTLPQPPSGVRYAIDPVSAMVVEIK